MKKKFVEQNYMHTQLKNGGGGNSHFLWQIMFYMALYNA